MRRKPGLDGLRALAILAVMAFHTSPAAHGGFVGVDVFFVVSGYLITALLLAEIERTGTVDLRACYVRRTLRLLPALVLMLLLTIPLMLTSLRDTVLVAPAAAVASSLFYATTSRADGLLLGTLLAVTLARRGHRPLLAGRHSEAVAWAGMAGVAVLMAVLRPDGGATFRFGLLAVSLCTVAVVHHLAVATDGPLVRTLTWRPLVAVGTVSYGLYLFHFPVFQAVQHAHPPHVVQHVLELVLTVALTLISYVAVERPALRLKDRLAGVFRREPATVPTA
jgi:peptidoglycan/LPS O-acetylase OafA/YrhL